MRASIIFLALTLVFFILTMSLMVSSQNEPVVTKIVPCFDNDNNRINEVTCTEELVSEQKRAMYGCFLLACFTAFLVGISSEEGI